MVSVFGFRLFWTCLVAEFVGLVFPFRLLIGRMCVVYLWLVCGFGVV